MAPKRDVAPVDFPESSTSSKNSPAAVWPQEVAVVGLCLRVHERVPACVRHAEVVCFEKRPGGGPSFTRSAC